MLSKSELIDTQNDILDKLNDNMRDDRKQAEDFAEKLAKIYDLKDGKEIFGDLKIVQELLKKNYDDVLINLFIERQGIIDLRDENERTLFLLAAIYDKSLLVEIVLENRPDAVGQRDKYGNTAIIVAARQKKGINTVKAILKVCPEAAGQQNKGGQSAKSWALNNGNYEMFNAIKAAANEFSPERQAVWEILNQ